MMDFLQDTNDEAARCFSSAVYRFKTSMIGRIDDCSKFASVNLTTHFQHGEYSALARLYWSKNVRKEADAPQQILLGTSDPHYCVLLGLATWIAFFIQTHGRNNEFVFNYHGSDNPI